MWPDRRILDLLGIGVPILLAPMAGPGLAEFAIGVAELAIGVAEASGLGAIPTALLGPDPLRREVEAFRRALDRPLNLNFFCHTAPTVDAAREAVWRARLAPYYRELAIDPAAPIPTSNRAPFDAALCALVEQLRPEVVSFHFGLPAPDLLDHHVRATGAAILSSATTVDEARWLEAHGCAAIIAQGAEAGGHRGSFLGDDPRADAAREAGTLALVPQIVDAVRVPVIAAGGIADALGASAVQLGTAYLFCPEAKISAILRAALRTAQDNATAITNVFTGRPARGIVNRAMRELGPLTAEAPAFPLAGGGGGPLKTASPGSRPLRPCADARRRDATLHRRDASSTRRFIDATRRDRRHQPRSMIHGIDSSMRTWSVVDLGTESFRDTWARQFALVEQR